MDEKVFDYLQAYVAHMLPEARARLTEMPVYQEYQSEKRRLSDLLASFIAQEKPFSDAALLADIRKLETLGDQVLTEAKRLDPYDD